MAVLHLVTGYNGYAHITSADQGAFNAGCVGLDDYVLATGSKFEARLTSNNKVEILDGSLVMNGRHVHLESGYTQVSIENGTEGMSRNDIVAIRYEVDTTTGVESVSLVAITGTASAGTPTDPEIPYQSSILNGATVHDMPLYRVVLNGVSIERIEPMFKILAPMADIQHGFYKQNMLINGDFLINSRGTNTYNADGKSMYSLDMWRAFNVKVQKVANVGVKLTGLDANGQGYFTQFIQLGKLKTTTYTISAMADDRICTFTVTPGGSAKEKDFGTFKISALTTSTWDDNLGDYNNKLKINICPVGTNTITFQYIDVFEGVIAYPHIKEDPATARMRCRRYVQCGTTMSPYMWYANDGTDTSYRCTLCYEPMAAIPTLGDCTAWFYTSGSQWLGVQSGGIKVIDDDVPTNYALNVEINTANKELHERCKGFEINYVLTCEPNDA